ncbi:Rid family hydrolase [Noviherbaspirillum sp. 1P10PC]|uniref:RidA family protein n=1 Tax=Noviherbaspirillum sp. 1P10PC TaxID=3132292 RepID=UPI0039A1B3BA
MSSIKRHASTLPFPFSRAVQAGNLLFLSGQIPMDADGKIVTGEIGVQAQAVMDRIGETLQLAGAEFSDVVKVTVWLADMGNLEQFNAVYRRYFSDGFPARSAVQARLAFDVGVEVEMQAWIGG